MNSRRTIWVGRTRAKIVMDDIWMKKWWNRKKLQKELRHPMFDNGK